MIRNLTFSKKKNSVEIYNRNDHNNSDNSNDHNNKPLCSLVTFVTITLEALPRIKMFTNQNIFKDFLTEYLGENNLFIKNF